MHVKVYVYGIKLKFVSQEKTMLTQTTEYALRAVTFLAARAACGETPLSADKIAAATQIPRRYLPRVMQNLTAEGLVESRCGVQGGYVLARSAEAITILDIVNAVEPIKRICNCPLDLQSHTSLCPLHAELDHAYELAEQAFANVTIAGLLNSTNPIIPLIDSP